MYEEPMKNRPQLSTTEKGVKRIFVTTAKTKERSNFHTVLFFISQNGRPDEINENTKQHDAGTPL